MKGPDVVQAAAHLAIAQQHLSRAAEALRSDRARRQLPEYYETNRAWHATDALSTKLRVVAGRRRK
jgi:hypothetical protein